MSELDRRTKMIKKDIPKEFKRQMRPTNWCHNFKASEHRFFALYIGPIVLKNILQDNYYDHFLLYHVAIKILSSKEVLNHTNFTKKLLKDFVEQSKTLNTHNLNVS